MTRFSRYLVVAVWVVFSALGISICTHAGEAGTASLEVNGAVYVFTPDEFLYRMEQTTLGDLTGLDDPVLNALSMAHFIQRMLDEKEISVELARLFGPSDLLVSFQGLENKVEDVPQAEALERVLATMVGNANEELATLRGALEEQPDRFTPEERELIEKSLSGKDYVIRFFLQSDPSLLVSGAEDARDVGLANFIFFTVDQRNLAPTSDEADYELTIQAILERASQLFSGLTTQQQLDRLLQLLQQLALQEEVRQGLIAAAKGLGGQLPQERPEVPEEEGVSPEQLQLQLRPIQEQIQGLERELTALQHEIGRITAQLTREQEPATPEQALEEIKEKLTGLDNQVARLDQTVSNLDQELAGLEDKAADVGRGSSSWPLVISIIALVVAGIALISR